MADLRIHVSKSLLYKESVYKLLKLKNLKL